MNNIYGTPNPGHGGSDWWDISMENKFGGWPPVNERHHSSISRGKSMLSGILAVVCGVVLGAVGGWYLSELCLWLITR